MWEGEDKGLVDPEAPGSNMVINRVKIHILSAIIIVGIVLMVVGYTLFRGVPDLPPSFNINQSILTPYFSMTLPPQINQGQSSIQEKNGLHFYQFLTKPYNDQAASQVVVKIFNENNTDQSTVMTSDLNDRVNALFPARELDESLALKVVEYQSPESVTLNGVNYSKLDYTIRDTEFVFLETIQNKRVYVFELVSRNEDATARKLSMINLLSSISGVRYRVPTHPINAAFLCIVGFLIAVFGFVKLFSFAATHRLRPMNPVLAMGEDYLEKQEKEIESDPVISKYRDNNTEENRALKSRRMYIYVGIIFFLVAFLLLTNDWILQYIHVWTGAVLGLVFLLVGLNAYVKKDLFKMGYLMAGVALEFSSAITWWLYPGKISQYFDEVDFFAAAAFIAVLGLWFIFNWQLRRFLKQTFDGKIVELSEPIILKKGSMIKPPPFGIALGHVGTTIINGYKVFVVGDDLSLPVGTMIKLKVVASAPLILIEKVDSDVKNP